MNNLQVLVQRYDKVAQNPGAPVRHADFCFWLEAAPWMWTPERVIWWVIQILRLTSASRRTSGIVRLVEDTRTVRLEDGVGPELGGAVDVDVGGHGPGGNSSSAQIRTMPLRIRCGGTVARDKM